MQSALAPKRDNTLVRTDEGQRVLCFDLFNGYWDECRQRGIAFDVLATMSISAALVAVITSHGPEKTAEFLDDLAAIVRSGGFRLPQKASH